MVSGMSRMQRRVDRRDVWTLDTEDFAWTFVGDAEPLDALINYGLDTESGVLIGFNLEPAQTWEFNLVSQTWEQRNPGRATRVNVGQPPVWCTAHLRRRIRPFDSLRRWLTVAHVHRHLGI